MHALGSFVGIVSDFRLDDRGSITGRRKDLRWSGHVAPTRKMHLYGVMRKVFGKLSNLKESEGDQKIVFKRDFDP